MFNLSYFRSLRIGGSEDSIALTALVIAILFSSPFFQKVSVLVPMLMAAASGIHFSTRMLSFWSDKGIIQDAFHSGGKHPIAEGDGVLIGYRVDTGEAVCLNDEFLTRHILLTGASGTGKTVFLYSLMVQQILRGGSVAFVDGKLDYKNLADLYAICKWAGREHDFLVINPDDPKRSNTYNPILWYQGKDLLWSERPTDILKDPDECSSAILSLIPGTDDNAGQDYYKQAANQGLTTIIGALQEARLAYNFIDLSILLTNADAMMSLVDHVPEGTAAKKSLRLFLNQFMRAGKDGSKLDINKMKEVFGGIGGRLHLFGSDRFGEITKSYNPDVNLFNAIIGNKILYVMLPVLAKDVAATNFAKMFLADLRVASARIQKMPDSKKPSPTAMILMDEAGGYVTGSVARLYETARSSRLCLLSGVQTLANIDAVDGGELTEMVVGNCWTKVSFKTGTQDTADRLSELMGMEKVGMKTIIESDSESASFREAVPGDPGSQGQGVGMGYTEREDEAAKIHADDLKALPIAQAIMSFGGDQIYHLKIPQFEITEEIRKYSKEVKINRFKLPERRGIDLFKKANQFLSDSFVIEDTGEELTMEKAALTGAGATDVDFKDGQKEVPVSSNMGHKSLEANGSGAIPAIPPRTGDRSRNKRATDGKSISDASENDIENIMR